MILSFKKKVSVVMSDDQVTISNIDPEVEDESLTLLLISCACLLTVSSSRLILCIMAVISSKSLGGPAGKDTIKIIRPGQSGGLSLMVTAAKAKTSCQRSVIRVLIFL